MQNAIIITICSLLLLAYFFDLSSAFTKIPSVILLLILGMLVKAGTSYLPLRMPDLNPVLPILGTIGLILIVLEGSLELELNRSKAGVIRKTFLVALIPILVMSSVLAFIFHTYYAVPFRTGLVNSLPFCVISSAIAIPSVRNLLLHDREFVIYESSFSDILGVLIFNFIVLNEIFDFKTFGFFIFQIAIIVLISFVSVLVLAFLLSRIRNHITYTPIILSIILIYAITKYFHLPGLVFIMVFGLFLGNFESFKRYPWIDKLRPEKLDKEVIKFKEITIEATFLVRSLFFLLFGFLIEPREIIDIYTLPWAAGIVALILLIRYITLKVTGLPVYPLQFIAPRGLITILLFISILPELSIPGVNNSLVIQTVLISVFVMMAGLFKTSGNPIESISKQKQV
ncbi:MAG: cation:proton antiporter [Bacteroidales bacterium]|nr:cation:proton antiporter [Bacteroidales bacterium]